MDRLPARALNQPVHKVGNSKAYYLKEMAQQQCFKISHLMQTKQ